LSAGGLSVSPDAVANGWVVRIEVEADGFLYNMVRNIVGTLVQVALGKRCPDWVCKVRDARDRTKAGPTAPANGLFLLRVNY
jgi:tRNA pseudouridine38-40 synthase